MTDKCNNPKAPRPARRLACSILLALATGGFPALAAPSPAPAEQAAPATISYARVADLVTSVSAVATVRVRSATPLKRERTPDLAPGRARFYIEADTIGLIRGDSVMATRVSFLLDGPDSKAAGKSLRKRSFLIFGKIGPQVGQFQLASSTALVAWSPANEALVRKAIREMLAHDAPPAITGISSAFHVPGAILGEGETQVFLETADGTPISLSIIRRPDEQPQFSASLGEIVDDSASFPAPDTPLWYRLACSLPDALPPRALSGLEPADATSAARDYNAFHQALAPCNRTPQPVF